MKRNKTYSGRLEVSLFSDVSVSLKIRKQILRKKTKLA